MLHGLVAFVSSRIATNSACNDSSVRCIGPIVASNFSRKGVRAASIVAAIMLAKSIGDNCVASAELCATGWIASFGASAGARVWVREVA